MFNEIESRKLEIKVVQVEFEVIEDLWSYSEQLVFTYGTSPWSMLELKPNGFPGTDLVFIVSLWNNTTCKF